jgi:hypothetical protein
MLLLLFCCGVFFFFDLPRIDNFVACFRVETESSVVCVLRAELQLL